MKVENCSHMESKEGTGSPQYKSPQRRGVLKSGVNKPRKRKCESSAHSCCRLCQSKLQELQEQVRRLTIRNEIFESSLDDMIQKAVERRIKMEFMKYPIFSALANVPTFVPFPTAAPMTVASESGAPLVDLNVSVLPSDEHGDSCSSAA